MREVIDCKKKSTKKTQASKHTSFLIISSFLVDGITEYKIHSVGRKKTIYQKEKENCMYTHKKSSEQNSKLGQISDIAEYINH